MYLTQRLQFTILTIASGSVSFISVLAGAGEATRGVGTSSIHITVIHFHLTLISICMMQSAIAEYSEAVV